MQQIEEIARKTPGVEHTVAIAGPVDPAQRQRAELRRDVRHARRLRAPHQARACPATRSPRRCRSDLQEEVAEGAGQRLRRAAGRGPGHGRRLQDRRSRTAATPAWRRCSRPPSRSSPPATTTRGLQGLFTSFRADTPWLYLDIDRDEGQGPMGVSIGDVFNTLAGLPRARYYVNDFNRFGRTWQVNVQADADVPRAGRGHQAAQGAQRPGRDGAAGALRHGRATSAGR